MDRRRVVTLGLTAGLAMVAAAAGFSRDALAAEKLAVVDVSAGSLAVRPLVDNDGLSVTVTGPGGFVLTRAFARGEAAVVELPGADGAYKYEVSLGLRTDAATRESLAAARAAQDSGAAPRTEAPPLVERGSFRVAGGVVDAGDATEAQAGTRRVVGSKEAGGDAPVPPTPDDQVIPDDLIVQGSICAGLDCVNNEDFGFDTIRLKENNTRINFNDTSVGTFPTNNWQIRANDSASGGASFLGFVDQGASGTSETGTLVFGVEAGAGANALWVDSTGRVGLGTGTPVLDLHVKTSNTPALRLEQDNSGGFTAQTWDVAGNEANFFVRDVTGGSRLPLRIRPGAPTSSIDISSTGNVGIGNGSPAVPIHVRRTDGTAQFRVEEASTTATIRTLFTLINNGPVRYSLLNTATSQTWVVDNAATNNYEMNNVGNAGVEAFITPTGNMTIAGTLTQLSDRGSKADIDAIDAALVLEKVARLPIATWRYKQDGADNRHMGPMAQDFSAAFGLGSDDKHIAPADMGGVALAAIQALNEVVQAENARLRKENAELAERLAAVEKALAGK